MGKSKEDFKKLFKHALYTFAAAIFIVVLAAAFSRLEHYFESHQYPPYLVIGARTIAIGLFSIDGIVVLGVAIILGVKILKSFLNHDD